LKDIVMKTAEGELLQPSKFRKVSNGWRVVSVGLPAISIIVGIIGVFHIRPFGMVMLNVAYVYLLAALLLPLCFFWIPPSKRARKDKILWYDILLMLVSLGIPVYLFLNTNEIIKGWAVPSLAPTHAIFLSAVLWAIAIEASRRAVGWVFAGVVLFISVFPLFGEFMPSLLHTRRYSVDRVILYHIVGEESFRGIPLHIFGRLMFGYMFFAVVLQTCGIGSFFNQIAIALLGRTRGGNAKVAIIASGLFGSISGHSGANIFATGTFTIPAMKKEGFTSEFAGAVEAAASTGGAVLPPIMGAVAFIMAEFLKISYATVCLAAVVPALLYYLCLFAQIDSHAARAKLSPSSFDGPIPKIGRVMFDNFHNLLGFATLIYFLFYMRLESWAPWFAGLVTFVIIMFRKSTRLNFKDFVRFIEDLGRTLGQMMGIMAPVGMIIGSLVLTGVAHSFPYEIVNLAGGNVYLLLIFGALASFLLGMGMSITACYIFLALVLVPSLVMSGLDLMASHMFVLYCGLWSFLTPPVALSAITAAIISGGNAMKTGIVSMRLAIATFIVPFFFILNPAMILKGPPLEVMQVVTTVALGLTLISGAFEGYIWGLGNAGIATRFLFFASGILLGIPESRTDIIGIVIAVLVFGAILLKKRNIFNYFV